jgi:hypothetical protein
MRLIDTVLNLVTAAMLIWAGGATALVARMLDTQRVLTPADLMTCLSWPLVYLHLLR